jgi:hypothetical protein
MRGTLRGTDPSTSDSDVSIVLTGRRECISGRLPKYPDFGITRLGPVK